MRNIINNLIVTFFISVSIFCQAQDTHKQGNYILSVDSKTGEIIMSKEDLKNATISLQAKKSGENVILKAFKLKCPGHKAIIVNGEKMTAEAIQILRASKIGDYVTVYDPTFIADGKEKTPSNTFVSILLK